MYVLGPPHAGLGPITGPVIDRAAPHELLTVGGVGVVAFATQATVELPPAGIENVGGEMVYVYTQVAV